MIMGSEGRGEQTVRTDQDNGLLLAAPVRRRPRASARPFGALERSAFRLAPAT